jgi:hypothetical protein
MIAITHTPLTALPLGSFRRRGLSQTWALKACGKECWPAGSCWPKPASHRPGWSHYWQGWSEEPTAPGRELSKASAQHRRPSRTGRSGAGGNWRTAFRVGAGARRAVAWAHCDGWSSCAVRRRCGSCKPKGFPDSAPHAAGAVSVEVPGVAYAWGHFGGAVSPVPSHDEHVLQGQRCACGSPLMYRRRAVMGDHGSETTFAAWCQANSEHQLPAAVLREVAELRSEFGP